MQIRVVQLTDIHLTAIVGSKLYGVDTALSLNKIVREIQRLSRLPDVIIATGDLAEDGSETTYIRLREILGLLGIPVYVLPGNHDNVVEMHSALRTGGFHYTDVTSMGGWGLVFVNSQVEGESNGYISSDELAKLEKNIHSLSHQPVLVSLHHTPSNMCPSLGCQLKNSMEFTALLNKYDNVKGVLAGHTHTAAEINAGGHFQFTSPSTFAHVTHGHSTELVDRTDPDDFWLSHHLNGALQGFRILDLLPEGKIYSEVCWLENDA